MPVRMTRPRVEKKMPRSSLTWQQGRAGVSPASSAFTSAANDVLARPPGLDYPPPPPSRSSGILVPRHNQKPGSGTVGRRQLRSGGPADRHLVPTYGRMVLARAIDR